VQDNTVGFEHLVILINRI